MYIDFLDLICIFSIILAIILIPRVIWDTKLQYIYVYKKLKIGDIYEKYRDPWKEPKRIEILDLKNKWIKYKDCNTNIIDSMQVKDLVDFKYKYIENNNYR